MSYSRATPGLLLVLIYLHTLQSWGKETAKADVRKPFYHKLRRLDEQFRRFQEKTLTHLQSIAENYNVSNSIDTRFQVLTQQLEGLLREFHSYRALTGQDLHILKSWTKKLQKRTKRLDLRLANMETTLKENSKVTQNELQEQRTALSNLTLELQQQQQRIGAVQSQEQEVEAGFQDLRVSLQQQKLQMRQLDERLRALQQQPGMISSKLGSTSDTLKDPLTSNLTPQEPTSIRLSSRADPVLQPKESKYSRGRGRLPSVRPPVPPRVSSHGRWSGSRMQGSRQTTTEPPGPPGEKEETLIQNHPQLPLRHRIPQHYTPRNTAKICNIHSVLKFPSASTDNSVTFRKTFATGVHELSICTWLRVEVDFVGTLLSYATSDNDNTLVLYGRDSVHGSMDFVVGDPAYRELAMGAVLDGRWHHLCLIWSSIEGRFWQYIDRRLTATGSKFQKGFEIPPGGTMVLGQEQDELGGGFDAAEAFVGQLAGFAVWTRVLSPGEVSGVATGRGLPRGAVFTLEDVERVSGSVQQVTCECLEHCT